MSLARGRALTSFRSFAWRLLGAPPGPGLPTPAPAATAGGPAAAGQNHWSLIASLAEGHAASAGDRVRFHYTWGVLHAANIARTLGLARISALEFGCAGGNGLVALEAAAELAERELGVGVEVHGFDNAVGLPPTTDYRDAPYLMAPGQFPMDEARLRARLSRTHLHLGLVSETIEEFLTADAPPVGFVVQDLDYYTSTVDAFRLFDAPATRFLPRVLSYFDDTLGYPWGESNGERLAIRHFNDAHDRRVIDRIEGIRYWLPGSQANARWTEALYVVHIADHPRANEDEGVALVTRLDLAP